MSIKLKRKSGITRLNNTVTTTKTEITTVETWVGPYDALAAKQDSIANNSESSSLTPDEAGNGRLTITYIKRRPAPPNSETEPPIIEVEWVELRRKLQEHPRYQDLSNDDRRKVEAALADPANAKPPTSQLGAELYNKLLSGQTEYSMAVPVIRKTTFNPTNLTPGGAWYRDNPPVGIQGWQFLKTADRVTRQGSKFNRVEEWTGAKKWDEQIYP